MFKYRSDPKIKIQVFLGTKKYFFFIKKQGIPVSQRNKYNKIHLKYCHRIETENRLVIPINVNVLNPP